MNLGDFRAVEVGGIDATAAADTVLFTPSRPIRVFRWGIIPTVLLDVGAGFVAALDLRPTIGSDTGRTNPGGTITRTADVAVGAGVYNDLSASGLTPPIDVDPGEQLVFEVSDAADTGGTIIAFAHYLERPFVQGPDLRIADMTLVTT